MDGRYVKTMFVNGDILIDRWWQNILLGKNRVSC